jgi:hypothetical protein
MRNAKCKISNAKCKMENGGELARSDGGTLE